MKSIAEEIAGYLRGTAHEMSALLPLSALPDFWGCFWSLDVVVNAEPAELSPKKHQADEVAPDDKSAFDA